MRLNVKNKTVILLSAPSAAAALGADNKILPNAQLLILLNLYKKDASCETSFLYSWHNKEICARANSPQHD
ncbi:hypothetical protein KKH38_00015 [Patescibacteria group bacterium]|nr:hypothetical protein [Patescibacteria group bacterium]MBU4600905.1 hypothetical protein [Patescibacteria group bacterium]MCG2698427.1 hypothetical protein [Candidatus Parcubacteria bacterium]